MSSRFSDVMVKAWYRSALWLYLLWPLSCLYSLVIHLRSWAYRTGVFASYRSSLPVIVVGNITLGGTGKSPMVAYLVSELRNKGFHPGVVSRGYGASIGANECREVEQNSRPEEVGDEPLMLKKRLNCPVMVSPNRRLAIQALEAKGCNIVISDDGMQHYAMARDVEICLFDGQRAMGNKLVLPAGPLREPASRLRHADFCVVNGGEWSPGANPNVYRMQLEPKGLVPVIAGAQFDAPDQNKTIHAVAAIGHPERFFKTLKKMGWALETHPFDDHHAFEQSDFDFASGESIVMTEKDAVKCSGLSLNNAWYLPVDAVLDGPLIEEVLTLIKHKGYLNG